MFRNYDWECSWCHHKHEELIDFPQGDKPPKLFTTWCPKCRKIVCHERMLSLPAKYLYDRPLNPCVKGGSFDTMGHKRLPALPEFTGETGRDFRDFVHTKEYQNAKHERAARKSENLRKKQRAKAMRASENFSIRNHPLPGDPSFKD